MTKAKKPIEFEFNKTYAIAPEQVRAQYGDDVDEIKLRDGERERVILVPRLKEHSQ